MPTSQDIVNEALALLGNNQPLVVGNAPNFDQSANGVIASLIYAPTVAAVARQFGWDFSRSTAPLVLSGNPAPFPWAYEYAYPAGAVQVWQIAPAALADPNDPYPIVWDVANAVVGGGQRRVIHTNEPNAQAVFNSNPREDVWDSLFHEAVVRLLASKFGTGTAGRPDTSQMLIESGSAFESLGESRRN